MVVVVFKIALRSDLPQSEYEQAGTRMVELVSALPGFAGMDYASIEGGELLIARFESHEALTEWRNHPEHVLTQQLGRERYFQSYRIEVCDLVRAYDYDAASAPT